MINYIQLFKTIHVIGFVSWFAGLFYLWRMFVYYAEAQLLAEPDKSILSRAYALMQTRVYKIICNPAMMITWTAGILILIANPSYMQEGWMHFKLSLLVLLTVFHVYGNHFAKRLTSNIEMVDPFRLRLMNEIPTLFLVSISALAVYRQGMNYLYFALALALFTGLILRGAYAYKKARIKNPEL